MRGLTAKEIQECEQRIDRKIEQLDAEIIARQAKRRRLLHDRLLCHATTITSSEDVTGYEPKRA